MRAAMAVASAVLLVLGPARPVRDDVFGGGRRCSFLVPSLAFAAVGAIVAARVPVEPDRLDLLRDRVADRRDGPCLGVRGLRPACDFPAASARRDRRCASGRARGRTHRLRAAALPGRPLAVLAAAPRRDVWDLPDTLFVTDLLRPGTLDEPFAMVSNPLRASRHARRDGRGQQRRLVARGRRDWACSQVVAGPAAPGLARSSVNSSSWLSALGPSWRPSSLLHMSSWLVWPHGSLQIRMAVVGQASRRSRWRPAWRLSDPGSMRSTSSSTARSSMPR